MKFLFHLIVAIWFSAAHAGAYEDFFRALSTDNDETVRQLLARGLDPNSRDERGQVALYVALRGGAMKSAALLMAHPQLQPDARNEAGETPLMMAALRGELDAMKRLLERGAPPHQDGWSPLHYAATGPEPKAVELLLAKGVPIDARSPNGSTPLMMAARYGNEGSVALLLARGADARLRNERRLSAGDFARQGGREKLAKELDARAR